MNFRDYLQTAFKNLWRRKMRTFLTILAVTVGSLAVILLVSITTGIKTSLDEMFKELDAFSLVTVIADPNSEDGGTSLIKTSHDNSSTTKKLDDSTITALKNINHVADATPIGSGLWINKMKLEDQDKKTWPNLIAYNPASSVLQMPVIAGRGLTKNDMDKIVVGARFVKLYNYTDKPEDLLGKKVVFSMQANGGVPDWGGLVPTKPPQNADKEWWESQNNKTIDIKAEIVGVAKSTGFDDSQNYINIAWAQRLMTQVQWEYPNCKDQNCNPTPQLVKTDNYAKNGYGSIILKVDDMNNLGTVAKEVEKLGYGVSTAEDMVAEINQAMLGISIILGVIGGIALFVAGIGIVNTMVMATLERTHEIGVWRACGATRAVIRRMFTFEAALLGFWGGVFGLGVSYLLGKIANYVVSNYVSNVDLPIDQIASFPWWLIIGVITFTTIVGLLSGLGPAIKAARLNPVDALRYE